MLAAPVIDWPAAFLYFLGWVDIGRQLAVLSNLSVLSVLVIE